MGFLDGEYEIKLRPEVKPFNLNTPRRIAFSLNETVKKELERLTEMDVIEKVESPTEWCSPMAVVPKQNAK